MKLTAIFLLAVCMQISARGLTQTVTLSVKDEPLVNVLKLIKQQTGYVYIADNAWLQKARKVSFTATNQPLTTVLDLCFKDQPIGYSISGKVIIISPKEKIVDESNTEAEPPVDVRGRVTNDNGDPVLVSITVKGGTAGTTTNENGEFILKGVEDNAILVFSGVGLETTEVKLTGKKLLNVTVKVDIAPLQETIIKGYYTTSRKLNTGNVTKIKGEELRKQPIGNPMQGLEGKVAGLFISSASGVPGRTETIRLRGQNSIESGNNPLILIDGAPFTSNSLSINGGGGGDLSPFNSLNPNDIESVEILKDADATAIYGSRGANGVIIITTKKGISGKTSLDINLYRGTGKVARKIELLNTQQYLQLRRDAFGNDGKTVATTDYDVNGKWDTTRYTDWQKVFIGNEAKILDAQTSISGGSSNTRFLISGDYRKETTVFPGDFYDEKISTHFNIAHQSSDQKFHLNFFLNYINGTTFLPSDDLTSNIKLAPNAPSLFDANGNLNWENNTWSNPFAILKRSNKTASDNLVGSLGLQYEIAPGLELQANSGYTNYKFDETRLIPLSSFSPTITSLTSRENRTASNSLKTWNFEPQLSYKRRLGDGEVSGLIGGTYMQSISSAVALRGRGFSSDAVIENIAAASSITIISNPFSKYRYNALFGRVNFSWRQKYLINATARRDGSTRYGPENRFGNFGAVGFAWIFSKEKFLTNKNQVLSHGKIRTSYGITGNDQIGDYNFMTTYSTYNYSYQGSSGLLPTRLPNPYYSWEKVRKAEAGIELGFIEDRIFLSISYYRNQTVNQVVKSPLPALTGADNIIANLPAVIQNKGLEFEIMTNNVNNKNFKWKSYFNLTIPKNKLISFSDLEKTSYANNYIVGKSLYIQRKLPFLGVDKVTGLYKFEDINNDGQLTFPQDYSFTKEISQTFYGGLSNNISFHGFQFDFSIYFVKQTNLNYLNYFNMPGAFGSIANQPTLVLNYWRKNGDEISIQKPSQDYGSASYTAYSRASSSSDAAISDASYIRLRNASVSYSLSQNLISKLHLKSARLYLSGQNLFTITNYQGLDPETKSLLPPLRILVVGAQLTL